MEIRYATDEDIPGIVNLLKLSLGETLLPKSEAYWRWKHVQNPFGKSPVLIALEKNEVVGVRAFMQWRWTDSSNVYRSLRAVDTATHPDHQGKGIFKKLTLSLVKDSIDQQADFVFNTPNHQSKPGYLKMGWEVAGRLPVLINVRSPFRVLKNLVWKNTGGNLAVDAQHDPGALFSHPGLPALLANHARAFSGTITTDISRPYLEWRYRQVPGIGYVVLGTGAGDQLTSLLIGRLKTSRLGNEFRITELFATSPAAIEELMEALTKAALPRRIDYIAVSGTLPGLFLRMVRKSGNYHKLQVGPVVTIRQLASHQMDRLRQFKQWSPTIGDLELF